jgi:hypothetical protein
MGAAALGGLWAAEALRGDRLPDRGELTLLRDEGGCTVTDEPGVRVRWSPEGATLEPVLHPMMSTELVATGPTRALPLPRALELAQTFQRLLVEPEPDAIMFYERTTRVQLHAAGLHADGTLDARPWASYAERLKVQAQATQSPLDWLRYLTFRAHLWQSRGLKAEPTVDGLLEEASGQAAGGGVHSRAAAST